MDRKIMLTSREQVEHLKDKGVRFELYSEEEAQQYLRNNNNFFKLASYRKNYEKYHGGVNKNKYIDLDFDYLRDLATIDMKLRYTMVQMSLDIEHYSKLEILRNIEDNLEDGYTICEDFTNSLKDDDERERFENEIARNKYSDYCKDLFEKYTDSFPVWVMLEMIPFGRMVEFYGFCADRYNSKDMRNKYYLLKTCRKLRNASAHSSCVLNDLHLNTITYNPSRFVSNDIKEKSALSSQQIRKRMSNARLEQIATLLYTHNFIVSSDGVHKKTVKLLTELKERINKNVSYYDSNDLVKRSLEFLLICVDIWF